MDDMVKEFLVESYENLDRLDRDFVQLEKNPSVEILGSIFRAVHTIKGTCGFLGFGKLESVTHVGESLMSLLRDGKLQVSQPITDALLSMVDAVREMLTAIEANGDEGERDDSALIERLTELQKGDAAVPNPAPAKIEVMPVVQPEPAAEEKKFGELLAEKGELSMEEIELALEEQAKGDPRRVGEILVQQGSVKPAEVLETLQQQGETRLPSGPAGNANNNQNNAAISDSTIRVDVGLLDKLMNLVGELVLARNQILQHTGTQEDATFAATAQHLNLVTSELQEGVMKTRMQPIGNVWQKFPRVVRDLATSCKKIVRVDMEGAETELDRTIIEAIKDPLTHVVRNSVDHGIEGPEARISAGKPAEGRLLLRAFHEGGQVNIEITDDGAGVNPERIRDKALQKNLITPEQAARMGEREMVNLIFLPGFSTAEKVSNISGRGVGMDVVKTNIEKIGGNVDVQSKSGVGTTLKVKIPLTLAIIPALMVTSAGDRYAIPQVSLLELVRLEGDHARKAVEMVHGAPVYRLRGNLLPLVYLNRELELTDAAEVDESINIVVLQADGRQFGLVVDAINDSKDIVVKPLGKHFKSVAAFSGATILGDGKVALILDVIGLSQKANVVSESRERARAGAAALTQGDHGERQTLLICRYGTNDRVAIDLSMVARLEQFQVSHVEKSGSQEVVQYRGQIMPLVRLSSVLGGEVGDEGRTVINVVVYREHNQSVGLVVEQIADIVEERVTVRSESHGSYLSGTAVVQGKVTDILDVRSLIAAVAPSCLAREAA